MCTLIYTAYTIILYTLYFMLYTLGGHCFENVHPDLYSVYDFSGWSQRHPGNPDGGDARLKGKEDLGVYSSVVNPITAFAEQGGAAIYFPSHHPMSRWPQTIIGNSIGRLGDHIDFVDLPAGLQTAQTASAVGALVEVGDAALACGSAGEAANDPAFDHRYNMWMTYNENGHVEQTFPPLSRHAKSQVWVNVALSAADQLRQRMAHALIQVYVIGPEPDRDGFEMTELYLGYYDILVRNAFGGFLTMLKEISFSPVMATYLTFLDSKSYASSGTFPDE